MRVASLIYFDKSVHEFTLAEAAYLAALPKAPTNLHPFRQRDRAVERRNYVIDRMVEDRHVSPPGRRKGQEGAAQRHAASDRRPCVRRRVLRRRGAPRPVREIRREKLQEGGLWVGTTLDPKLQVMARKALTTGLVKFDEAQGYRGPVAKSDISGDWGVKIAEVKGLTDIAPWRLAVVLETGDQSARIGLQPGREVGGAVTRERQVGIVPVEAVKWARPATGSERFKAISRVSQVLHPGDVVYVEPLNNKEMNTYRLRQVPDVSGAMAVMDPWTGRVLALVGGFSYDQSQFNRATPGAAPTRVLVQAVRLRCRPRQRLRALDGGDGRADLDRHGSGRRRVDAGELFAQVLSAAGPTLRPRAVAQRDDGAARPGRRHAADRRIRQALRRL